MTQLRILRPASAQPQPCCPRNTQNTRKGKHRPQDRVATAGCPDLVCGCNLRATFQHYSSVTFRVFRVFRGQSRTSVVPSLCLSFQPSSLSVPSASLHPAEIGHRKRKRRRRLKTPTFAPSAPCVAQLRRIRAQRFIKNSHPGLSDFSPHRHWDHNLRCMATFASFTVCHPARPQQIGSGNRRLGNPRSNTCRLDFAFLNNNQQTTPRPLRIALIRLHE